MVIYLTCKSAGSFGKLCVRATLHDFHQHQWQSGSSILFILLLLVNNNNMNLINYTGSRIGYDDGVVVIIIPCILIIIIIEI